MAKKPKKAEYSETRSKRTQNFKNALKKHSNTPKPPTSELRRNAPDAEDEQYNKQSEAENVPQKPPAEVVALDLLRQLPDVLLRLLHRVLRRPGVLHQPVELLVRVDEYVLELGRRAVERLRVLRELVYLFLLLLGQILNPA